MLQSVAIKTIITGITLLLTTGIVSSQSNTRPFLNTFLSISKAPYITYIHTVLTLDGNITSEIECTGSILEKNYVLTLATCVGDTEDKSASTYIFAGTDYKILDRSSVGHEQDEGDIVQRRTMEEVIKHPLFKTNRLAEPNLALIKVNKPFELSEEVSPLTLDGDGWPVVDQRPDRQRNCEVIGFGDTNYKESQDRLKTHSVKAYHDDSCACAKRTQWMSLVCLDQLEDVGLCKEYNGAPLICNGKGVAINQLLVARANCSGVPHPEDICGDYNVVSFFLYLCPFLGWIKNTVKTVPDQPKYCNHSPPVYYSNYLLILTLWISFTTL